MSGVAGPSDPSGGKPVNIRETPRAARCLRARRRPGSAQAPCCDREQSVSNPCASIVAQHAALICPWDVQRDVSRRGVGVSAPFIMFRVSRRPKYGDLLQDNGRSRHGSVEPCRRTMQLVAHPVGASSERTHQCEMAPKPSWTRFKCRVAFWKRNKSHFDLWIACIDGFLIDF